MNPTGPEPGADQPAAEPDSRFPSGPWTGFFLQPPLPGKHWMELVLTFRDGTMRGEGRDRVGEFHIKGRYSVEDGKCHWAKSYVGKHTIMYQGYNEGKGIWGTWDYHKLLKGGFRIWPVGMPDPTLERLEAAIDEPVRAPEGWIDQPADPREVGQPAGVEAEVRPGPFSATRGR